MVLGDLADGLAKLLADDTAGIEAEKGTELRWFQVVVSGEQADRQREFVTLPVAGILALVDRAKRCQVLRTITLLEPLFGGVLDWNRQWEHPDLMVGHQDRATRQEIRASEFTLVQTMAHPLDSCLCAVDLFRENTIIQKPVS